MKPLKYGKIIWSKWNNNCKTAYVLTKKGEKHCFCDLLRYKQNGILEPYFYFTDDSKYWQITMEINKEKRMIKHVEDCFKAHCNLIKNEYEALFGE